uniref:Alternative protein COL22A1 n=1 Tax=Homo sapiens TaxID=9606 RepID=L8EAR4_HUMAN|nr:alternative protein COL22A1 [Homo sapiens]
MDSLGSLGTQDSRAGPALLVWQDPREKRVTWDLRGHLVYQAQWCSKRA